MIKRILYVSVVFLLHIHVHSAFEKTSYTFSHDPIDVVIPCHKKDANTVHRAITSVQKYVCGLRRIIIVSSERFTDKVEWFDEALFPFSKESIVAHVSKVPHLTQQLMSNTRTVGWIYQQFLKLYAPFCIPNISANVLIVDADVIFLKPISFLNQEGAGLYAVGREYHKPYFEYAKRLLPDLVKLYPHYSGIVHHMLFQREVLQDFFDHIRAEYQCEPWIALARTITLDRNNRFVHSCLSEYEMYFNFVFARTDQVQIRDLKWKNITRFTDIKKWRDKDHDFVALHIYKE